MKIDYVDILRELLFSKTKGNALGIRIKGNDKIVVTAVEDVISTDIGKQIVLKSECIYGADIPQKVVNLKDIEGVVRLRIMFEDPFYARLRQIKNNIKRIKTNLDRMSNPDYTF
jgi:hypothetical protein